MWWGNVREKYLLENLGVDGRIILKFIFKKYERWWVWTGLVWLKIGTNGRLLLTW